MITTFFTAIPAVLGLVLIASAIWEFMSWKTRLSSWTQGTATSRGAVKNRGDVGPKLAYEYNIDGIDYRAESGYMRRDLPTAGDSVTIYYDPDAPEKSEWYSGEAHRFFMFGVALLGALLIWIAIS